MKLFQSSRGEALTIILVVIIVAVFLGYLANIGSRECRTDVHCGSGYYCGSDFACHQVPTIEKTVTKNNLLVPSVIVGIAIIIAAIINKWGKFPFRKEEEPQEEQKKNTLKLP